MKTHNCTFLVGLQHQKKKTKLKKNCTCLYHMFYFANGSKQHAINKIINAGSFINSQNFIPLCSLNCSSGNKTKICKGKVYLHVLLRNNYTTYSKQ